MKRELIVLVMLFVVLLRYSRNPVPEPEQCSMCDDLSRHALCIINLSTGEKVELNIYDPHPFFEGEIAEEQPGGYFSSIRGDGIEGYKVAAEYVMVSVPVRAKKMDQQYFCNSCQDRLATNTKNGYVLVDL